MSLFMIPAKVFELLFKNSIFCIKFSGKALKLVKKVINGTLAGMNLAGKRSDLLPVLGLGCRQDRMVELRQGVFICFNIIFCS